MSDAAPKAACKATTGNLKGSWNQAILTFIIPIVLVMGLRWALVEPFVIPSGSMIPSLLVHDHILVKKFSFGLHVPFSETWLLRWQKPERGQVIVFRYPENPDVYYIKRLIGLPGDEISTQNGRITLNGEKWPLEPLESEKFEAGYSYFYEDISGKQHVVRFLSPDEGEVEKFRVPEGQYFFMGDNRDQSSDSRVWGFVNEKHLIGRAWVIWLSCDSTLPTMTFVCDPSQIRWKRIFQKVD